MRYKSEYLITYLAAAGSTIYYFALNNWNLNLPFNHFLSKGGALLLP
ncbi:hypothetical protein [Mycoplasma parvum]|uniref:Uncharacterized protein n=1 Tax=Mycoplasma parvum str. Indiana TaxID=1403316 RepID=U5ND12_9MOLU|nr:hypothetical protein [Mycoplasma parvum]AGX89312.1 hypothetical protein PRV_02930 [Mycoplasma parvum str. Indiana]